MTLELSLLSAFRFQSALLIREGSQKWLPLTQQQCVYIYGMCPYSVSLLPLSHSFTAIPLCCNPHALSTTILLLLFLLKSSIIRTALVDVLSLTLLINMRRGQSVDSSSDEYEPTDSETEYASGTETESTDVDDEFDE